MQIHPRLAPEQVGALRRGIARGGLGRTSHRAEINQHRQAIAVAAQQVGGAEVAVHQLLAVQHRQHRQQLAQQQQHLAGTKHQLPCGPGLEQLLVGATCLPFAHQPQPLGRLDRRPHARHLGMEHPLQPAPALTRHGQIDFPPQ